MGARMLAGRSRRAGLTVAVVGVGGLGAGAGPRAALVGAGMGLGITPLATMIMAGMQPEHAGATSGVLSTMQNVGNALGVAVIGVVFFGAVSHGFAARVRAQPGRAGGDAGGRRRADPAAPGAGTLVMVTIADNRVAAGGWDRFCATGASAAASASWIWRWRRGSRRGI